MPVGAAAYAAIALRAKSGGYAEQGRQMGRRHGPGPWTPERREKMRATLNSMSIEALRICRIERKARWLTRLIVAHVDRKVFAFDGIDPLTRRRFKMRLEFPLDVTLSEFLIAVMNCPDTPITMRLDCAKNAAALVHERPKPVVTVTVEQREQRRERRREYQRRRYQRLSARAATDEATEATANG